MQLSEANNPVLKPQPLTSGAGPEYHRIFTVDLGLDEVMALRAMNKLKADPGFFAPYPIASIVKTRGSFGEMNVGDEFNVIHTMQPISPVRVTHVEKHGFSLQTLDGNIAAGEIHMRIRPNSDHDYRFEIESLARSRDRMLDLLYDKIPVNRFLQSVLWAEFSENFAREALVLAKVERGENHAVITTHRKGELLNHRWVTLEEQA